jgi:hypothetical protein
VPDLAAMRRGVAVLAAAPGRVARVRDGMDDVSIRETGREAVANREAGNGLVIEHGDGWETQYSHLRKGSLAVRAGDRVEAGQRLGLIGLSGNTEFPHVDFMVRHNGALVDPFLGPDAAPGQCGAGGAPLWTEEVARMLAYQPTGVLNAGFAAEPPAVATARDGGYGAAPERGAPVVGFWTELFGAQAGDEIELGITGPDGRTLKRSTGTVPRPLAVLFVAAVAERPPAGWPPGVYQGRMTLTRKGAVAADATRRVEIR